MCRDRVWPWIEFLCRDRVFLRRERVWPKQGILGRDRVFSCRDRVWGKGQESLHHDKEFDVATELSKLVSQQGEPSVATESSRTWGFPCHGIALYVVTMGQGTMSQPGCARVIETLCRDSVALCCVATKKAMRVRQTRSGTHNKASTPRLGGHDRGILSRQTSYSCKKKKKKRPPGIRASQSQWLPAS